jgi:hypothetical protein
MEHVTELKAQSTVKPHYNALGINTYMETLVKNECFIYLQQKSHMHNVRIFQFQILYCTNIPLF